MKKRQLLTFLLLLLCRFLSAQVIFEPVEGNRLWSTKDGLQFLSRIMEDMEGAQTAIDIEYYWFAEDEAGTRVRDLLIRKAREGVQVRLIMDNLITPFAKESFYEPMRKAGVDLRFVHALEKMGPFQAVGSIFGERDHRKIVVIDGHIAYTGGMNFYQRALIEWADTQIRVEGPVALQLRALFQDSWERMGGGELESFPEQPVGEVTAQAVGTSRREQLDALYVQALQGAKEYFYLQTPYFAPPPTIMEALKESVARGVDVRMMVPAKSDWEFMNMLTREYGIDLFRAGVKVYVYNARYDHTKIFICDDILSSCGTVNMDYRSLRINWEDAVLFHGRESALHFKERFLEEMAQAKPIGPEDQPIKGIKKAWLGFVQWLQPIL